jgi:hypothetical protein
MTEPETISTEEDVLNILYRITKTALRLKVVYKRNSVILKYFTPAALQQLKGKRKMIRSITIV